MNDVDPEDEPRGATPATGDSGKQAPRHRVRRVSAWVLVVLASLLIPISVISVWANPVSTTGQLGREESAPAGDLVLQAPATVAPVPVEAALGLAHDDDAHEDERSDERRERAQSDDPWTPRSLPRPIHRPIVLHRDGPCTVGPFGTRHWYMSVPK